MQSRWFQEPYCQAFPLAHLMRGDFPENWLRIHSLPASKRYPDCDSERETVLDRYAQFGSALLGEDAPCLIFQSVPVGLSLRPKLMPELAWLAVQQVGDDEDDRWDSWMTRLNWQPKILRPLLLAIAEDRERHIAFLSETTDCVFVPYDGGADGFSLNEALVRRLSSEFGPWQSSLASGL